MNKPIKTAKSVLVTGGAGYIGAHACKALAIAGYTPVTYDNLVYGHRRAVKWGPLEEGDIGDRGRLETVLRKYDPAAVMHFAAYAYVGESVQNPAKYYRNNVAGTLSLLESMKSLVAEPKVILFDEPLSNLDAKLREETRKDLRVFLTELQITAIYVTHDRIEALSLSDIVAVMNKGQIVETGEPQNIY